MSTKNIAIALIILATGLALTAALDSYQQRLIDDREREASRNAAKLLSSVIKTHMESKIQSIERMAQRLQRERARNGEIDFQRWAASASDYLDDQEGHIHLQLLDAKAEELITIPPMEQSFSAELYAKFEAQNPGRIEPGPDRAAYANAVGTIPMDNGQDILALAFPLFHGDTPIGYLISLTDVDAAIDYIIRYKLGERYDVNLTEHGRSIFANSDWPSEAAPSVELPNLAKFGNVTWSVQARSRAATGRDSAADVAWTRGIAIALSILSALIAYLSLQNRESLRRAKESEAQLRETSRLRDLVMEHTPDLIFVKDAQFRLRQLNPAMLSLYAGKKLEDILGTTTIEDYNEDEADEFLYYDRMAFETGRSETEESIVFPNGQQRVLLTTKVRFEDAQGEPYILGVARDITSLKNYEEKLSASEQRYKLAVDGTSVGLWDWDCKSGELFRSSLLKNMLGIPDDADSSKFEALTDRIHPEDRDTVLAGMQDHLENRTPFRADYRIAQHDGSYMWVHSRGQAIWDENGEPIRMVGSIDDITEKKLAQNELLRSNQELDDFAYIASHDLLEPLRGVSNHARFLEEDYKELLGEDGKHRIQRMLFLTQHMGRLISDLLEYSRISRENATVKTVNLNSLVEEIIASYESDDIEIVIANPLPVIECSEAQVSAIFRNLIANGLKYNDSEHKTIVIGCTQEASVAAGSMATYSVCDNGIGIPEKFRGDVFKIFKRLHATADYDEGTGSGLALVKKIVEKYHGEIWIDDNTPKGSCVNFTLPDASIVAAREQAQ